MILEHFKEFNKFGIVGKPRQWNIKMRKILEKRRNKLASLAKWLSVRLQTKIWCVRVPLQWLRRIKLQKNEDKSFQLFI